MKELKIVVSLVGTVVLAITGLFYLATGMMAGVADDFFTALKKQDFAAARSYLTEDFNAGTDEAALRQFLVTSELVTFKQAVWSDRHLASARGRLDGEIITGNGGMPLMMMFVKEHGDWKIYAIQKSTAGSVARSVSLPTRREQVALVKRAMLDFGISVRDHDMKHFHSVIAPRWARQSSPEKFNKTFANVMSSHVDFSILERYEPLIDPPSELNEDGELILEGHFPTEPNALHFKQTYIYEGLGWKLVGFGFHSGQSESKPDQPTLTVQLQTDPTSVVLDQGGAAAAMRVTRA